MTDLVFSKMTDSDLKQLYDFASPIWFECYKDVLSFGQIDYLTHKYFDYENILEILAGGMIYENILLNSKKVGFIAYSLHTDFTYLDKIYIEKSYRGMHISSACFDDLISRYKKPIRLNVNQGNELGIRAYKCRGFRIIEEKSYPLPGGYVNIDFIMEKSV